MKKAFSLVEIVLVLVILTAIFFVVVPFSVSNVKQAKYISEWKSYMEQVYYSFEILTEYKKTNFLNEKASEERLLHYLDAKPLMDKGKVKNYKYKMMNGNFYQKMNIEKFDEIYEDANGRLIGIEHSPKNSPYAIVWTDLNGAKKPNIVGKDIFVYEIYKTYVSPYGKGLKMESVKLDCSKAGTGRSCSQYYLLGGDLK